MNDKEHLKGLDILIKNHKEELYYFILKKIHDRGLAEDIFQETFIKVIQALKNGQYVEKGKFVAWIKRISHNLVIDFYRKNKKINIIENLDFISDSSPNVEDVLINDQIIKDIQKLIQKLPEDQKEVLIMRLYRDMSFKEIAENTKVSINTALGRMRGAIINLRKLKK